MTARRFDIGVNAGLLRNRIEDVALDDAFITIDGRRLINFGSAAYLALDRDPRLKAAAIDAVERYGTAYSSSTAYTSLPLYATLEEKLRQIFDAPIVIAQTTTLVHLAVLPVAIAPEDLVLVDGHAHASVQLAAKAVRGAGTTVEIVPHNDIKALRRRLSESAPSEGRIWYLADGIYSMLGDPAPVRDVVDLLDEFPTLHCYFDDAHGFGWQGLNGRGSVLQQVPWHERLIVVGGLSKSFGALGAVAAFGDAALAWRVQACGGPVTFSGPMQPAGLGAAIASADIHLSAEHAERQSRLLRQIDFVRERLTALGLPVLSLATSPIWFIRIGGVDRVVELLRRLRTAGYYVNPSTFPMVPIGYAGIRFTQTLHHSDEHLEGLLDALGRHVPDLVDDVDMTIDLRGEESDVLVPEAADDAALAE
ncbi:MAG: aminotransferase class I/II-fold pyridoxal phosphate-dependent enzyme [Actinomycetota bacterium]|nr:aminotransferase class I/II-fold pyridoxal phosphate-dependent enzyme [Actinomycetota bacterium]